MRVRFVQYARYIASLGRVRRFSRGRTGGYGAGTLVINREGVVTHPAFTILVDAHWGAWTTFYSAIGPTCDVVTPPPPAWCTFDTRLYGILRWCPLFYAYCTTHLTFVRSNSRAGECFM